jgi:hypothetical protein
MNSQSRYLRSCLVAGVVAAVVAAPTSAATRPDDRPGPRGAGAAAPTQLAKSLRPDDRPGIRGPGAAGAVVTHDGSTAFAWRDAAIGGALTLALALGVGALIVSLRRRGSPTPA